MTEERFGQIIEYAVEGAAQKLDKSIERSMQHKEVRYFTKLISYTASIGLIAGAIQLKSKGYDVIAKICLITGGIAIVTNILLAVFLRKE